MSMKVEREAFTDEKRMRMRSKRSTSHENGVIISIYVETPIIRTRDKNDAIKRINSEPKPNSLIFSKPPRTTALRSCGYDRRAQLLVYAQELRHANNSKLHQEGSIKKSFMPRSKKQRRSPSLSFLRWFHPAKRRWRYEHIVTDEQSKVDNRRKTTRGRRYSRICRRLRILLKELSSCTCQGNKAYDDLE